MPRLRHILLLCAALVALAAPANAAAASSQDVIRDCYQDGKLDGSYTQQELDNAQRDLPSDVDEYSDCRNVIASARARGGRGKRGGSGGVPGGGFRGGGTAGADPSLSTPSGALAGSRDDLNALSNLRLRDHGSTGPKVPVAGQPITPTSAATSVGKSANDMPTPLLAALIALGALGALGALFAVWRRRPQRLRRGPLPLGRS
jgi:hypothetical protein